MVVAAVQACRFCADSLATFSTLLRDLQIVLEDHQIDWYQQKTLGAQPAGELTACCCQNYFCVLHSTVFACRKPC